MVRDGATLLDYVDWAVDQDQRWVVLGPNGAGKTTLLRIASTRLFPTRGTVDILGERLGRGRRVRTSAANRLVERGAGGADPRSREGQGRRPDRVVRHGRAVARALRHP